MTARGSRVTAGGIWAQEVGTGPLVALVHGAMDRSGGMLRVRRLLQPSCRVLRYDRRGYARSRPAGPPVSFDQQVDDLVELLEGRPAVVAGHSFGGLVALALAERRPDLVAAVVAFEAPTMWEPWWPGSSAGSRAVAAGDAEEAAEGFLRRVIGDEMWERLPAAMRAERRAEGVTLLAEMRSVRPPQPPPFDAGAVAVPVIAGVGSRTGRHHRRAVERLARDAPRGELRVVEGAGHDCHLTHPAELADLVRLALARSGRAPAASDADGHDGGCGPVERREGAG
ncbi:MAG TPA: alpha/beta hydrolase [Acidimicrobiales bacterium]|nr:alpha/beta hydrolase [Acidimicrobiales bacterium]